MKAMRTADAISLEPSVFAKVVLAGIAAGEGAQQGDPLSVDRVEADGSLSMLQVPDSPNSRAAFAIKRQFPHDEKAFRGALARFNALMNLFSRNALVARAQWRIRVECIAEQLLDVDRIEAIGRATEFAVDVDRTFVLHDRVEFHAAQAFEHGCHAFA